MARQMWSKIRELDDPAPGTGEVLVRVHAASVNRADMDALYARWGFLRLFLGLRRPRSTRLGIDAAGVVEAVGPGVTAFAPGDRVFADLFPYRQDAYSELVCAPERAWASLPPNLTFEAAATLPHSAILALQGLRRRDGRSFGHGARVLVVGRVGQRRAVRGADRQVSRCSRHGCSQRGQAGLRALTRG